LLELPIPKGQPGIRFARIAASEGATWNPRMESLFQIFAGSSRKRWKPSFEKRNLAETNVTCSQLANQMPAGIFYPVFF